MSIPLHIVTDIVVKQPPVRHEITYFPCNLGNCYMLNILVLVGFMSE